MNWSFGLIVSRLVLTARKAHRNGIKKPTSQRYESLKGVSSLAKSITWRKGSCTFVHTPIFATSKQQNR